MAPTSSALGHSPNSPSGRRHHLRRQLLGYILHPPVQSSALRTERPKPRTLDPTLQPTLVPEGPSPPPFAPMPSQSGMFVPNPSAVPAKESQPQGPSQPGDVPGNLVAAIVVMILVLGGLIGLVIGGEMLRRETKTPGKRASRTPSRCTGRRRSKPIKSATTSAQKGTKTEQDKFPYDGKTLTPLTRPPPVLSRERQRRFSDTWPVRSLSRILCNRRSNSEQVARHRQPPVGSPQTTWSEFSPVSLYAAPRTVLTRIPEEGEEEIQTHGDSKSGTLRRSLECDFAISPPQMEQPDLADVFLKELGSSVITGRRVSQDRRDISEVGTKDEDASIEDPAPDMTADGGESSRSSTVSLESVEDGRESAKEEVFELKRAQTRSMQMDKGVLLSLGLRTPTDGAVRPIGGVAGAVERELSLGGSFSAVNLDEFPSPPSILPVIPSFVSGF